MGHPEADVLREVERLRDEVEDLRASRRRLALAVDAERCGIERALHDGVQQELIGLAVNLERLAESITSDPAATERLVAELRDDIKQAVEEMQRLAHRIYPPLLEAGGLAAALRWIAAASNVPIRIDVAAVRGCPREIAAAVFFCCQEMIDRVDAGTSMGVTVRRGGGVLTYEIEAKSEVDTGGVIPDRTDALGGDMTIRRAPGRTQVVGSLPLPG